jgi:hypothetical protein
MIVLDLANNHRVRNLFRFSFIQWIKEAAAPEINTWDDWPITWHCHTQLLSTACKIGCVGQFSPEIDTLEYTMFTSDERLTFAMKSLIDRTNKHCFSISRDFMDKPLHNPAHRQWLLNAFWQREFSFQID